VSTHAETRILVVDDDPLCLQVIAACLKEEGYRITTASTGQEALSLVRENPTFDVILLDVLLPDTDGIAVCRQLKADPSTTQIPIILISGFRRDDESVREGLAVGAVGYLAKPIDDVPLRAWIKATLRIRALEQELFKRGVQTDYSYEEALRTFSKLSHAVNNPLQALYASVDMLTMSFPDNQEAVSLGADILSHAERVAKIVAQASIQAKELLRELAFSRTKPAP